MLLNPRFLVVTELATDVPCQLSLDAIRQVSKNSQTMSGNGANPRAAVKDVVVALQGRRIPADFLMDPVVVVAVAVLLLNDHVLKGQFGNWWTGKLSDVAGMVFFPILAVALIEVARRTVRRGEWAVRASAFWSAAILTALAFTLVKTVPAATAAAQAVNHVAAIPLRTLGIVDGITVRQDPSDLLAVPFVLLGVWVGYRWRQESKN